MPGHNGHPEEPKTRDEDRSTRQKSNLQKKPEPVQGVTTKMITELSKVSASEVHSKIFCLKDMFPNYSVKAKPDILHDII